MGGRGLAAKYFAQEVDPRIEPLAPENKLIFATGPLTGTNASCGARYMVVTKGALNQTITTSNSGGFWGPELKFAGYDMIIVEGRADRPVYVWIFDDAVEIRDAGELWGTSVWETEDRIRERTGVPDARIASIGQAGERLVRFAGILNDRHRAAGRNGVGAVMGSKNLKAIAVRGTGAVSIARPADWLRAQWALKRKRRGHPVTGEGLPQLDTAVLVHVINESGAMPTMNWQHGRMRPAETGSDAENISGERLQSHHTIRNKACFACTIACGRVTQVSAAGVARHAVLTSPHNLERTWLLRAGSTAADDTLPKRLLAEPIPYGPTKGQVNRLQEMLPEYYRLRGWNERGEPLAEKLAALDLV